MGHASATLCPRTAVKRGGKAANDNMSRLKRPILRQATESDSEFAYHVKRAAFKEYVEQTWGWDEGWQRQYHIRHFDPSDVQIITHQGTDVGWLGVRREQEAIFVSEIYISPEVQSRGIGTLLLRQVLLEAGQRRVPVRLGVLKVNARARQLYERLGFQLVSETDVHYRMEALP
jgi:ribosomal protein S18 acetylase RimI-like enzyme